jgi:hypothetical protein
MPLERAAGGTSVVDVLDRIPDEGEGIVIEPVTACLSGRGPVEPRGAESACPEPLPTGRGRSARRSAPHSPGRRRR